MFELATRLFYFEVANQKATSRIPCCIFIPITNVFHIYSLCKIILGAI